MPSQEERILALEMLLQEQHAMYSVLFTLIFRSNDSFRLAAAEALRRMIQNPIESHPMSEIVRSQLRAFRDELLKAPIPEIVEATSQPPVRPV
jgi:hypothetical protein